MLLALGPVRSIQRTVGAPPAAGRSVLVQRVRRRFEPAHHRRAVPAAAGRAARSTRRRPCDPRSSRPRPRSPGRPAERRIELRAAGPPPRPDPARTRRSSRSTPPGSGSSPRVQPEEQLIRWRGGRRPRRAAAARAAGRGSPGSAGRRRRVSSVSQRGQQALAVPLEPAEQPVDAAAGHLRAEVGGGDVLEMMRLVEDQAPVGRQHRRFLPVVRWPAAPRGRRRAGDGSPPRRRPRPPGAGPGTGSSGRSGGT